MTATQTRIRRGTASQIDAMTPAADELISDTTNNRVRVGDGATAGGMHLPNSRDIVNQVMTYQSAGGTANALTLSLPRISSLSDGTKVSFKATATNTNTATLTINALSPVTLQKASGTSLVNLVAGDLVNGQIYEASYNGSTFQVLNIPPVTQQEGWVLLATVGVISNAFTFTGLMSDNYADYKLTYRGCDNNSTVVSDMVAQLSTDNGANWRTNNYINSAGGVPQGILIGSNVRTGRYAAGTIELFNMRSSGSIDFSEKSGFSHAPGVASAPTNIANFGYLADSGASLKINAVRIVPAQGPGVLVNGTASLYGLRA